MGLVFRDGMPGPGMRNEVIRIKTKPKKITSSQQLLIIFRLMQLSAREALMMIATVEFQFQPRQDDQPTNQLQIQNAKELRTSLRFVIYLVEAEFVTFSK